MSVDWWAPGWMQLSHWLAAGEGPRMKQVGHKTKRFTRWAVQSCPNQPTINCSPPASIGLHFNLNIPIGGSFTCLCYYQFSRLRTNCLIAEQVAVLSSYLLVAWNPFYWDFMWWFSWWFHRDKHWLEDEVLLRGVRSIDTISVGDSMAVSFLSFHSKNEIITIRNQSHN